MRARARRRNTAEGAAWPAGGPVRDVRNGLILPPIPLRSEPAIGSDIMPTSPRPHRLEA